MPYFPGSHVAPRMHKYGAFRFRIVDFRALDAHMMTTQCGAFHVHNIKFRPRNTRTMLASTLAEALSLK